MASWSSPYIVLSREVLSVFKTIFTLRWCWPLSSLPQKKRELTREYMEYFQSIVCPCWAFLLHVSYYYSLPFTEHIQRAWSYDLGTMSLPISWHDPACHWLQAGWRARDPLYTEFYFNTPEWARPITSPGSNMLGGRVSVYNFLPYFVIPVLTQSRIWCWHFWTMLLLVSVCFLNKVYATLLAKQL